MSPEAVQLPEPIAGDFVGKDILSIKQFDVTDVNILLQEAHGMKALLGQPEMADRKSDMLQGAMIDLFFYQPSTRTVLSFEKAAKKLGADVTKTTGVQYSSVAKGENLEDTIRTLEATCADAVVLRHSEVGYAALAASQVEIPIINGGDGPGEHPTQALLDLLTILEERGSLEDITVTMMGDLKNGRTVHSLARLLALYGAKLNYVAPADLQMPHDIVEELNQLGITQTETDNIYDVLEDTDILYDTRLQIEYLTTKLGEAGLHALEENFIITPDMMKRAPKRMSLLHPFPRVTEIDFRVDADPRAAYFRQIREGVHMRMAILAKIFGKSILSQIDGGVLLD